MKSKWISRACFAVISLLARIVGILSYRLELSTLPELPQGRTPLIIANHRSLIDVVVGYDVLGRWNLHSSLVVNQKYFCHPIFGPLLRATGAIPVKKNMDRRSLVVQVQNALETGLAVVIMPEGRVPPACGRTRGLGPLQPGAARIVLELAPTVVVVGIAGTDTVWPLGLPYPRPRVTRRPRVRVTAVRLKSRRLSHPDDLLGMNETIRQALEEQVQRATADVELY